MQKEIGMPNEERPTRRDLIKLTSVGIAALGQVAPARAQTSSENASPEGDIEVRVTAGAKRFAKEQALRWQPDHGSPAESITLNPDKSFQEVLGFGAALTDSSCYVFNQVPPESREKLFRELFHAEEMSLSVCRICIGSSDYATKAYSFDEGEPDPEMTRFSIDHDREYIIPMLKLARSTNPDLFLLGSPWSPPGWMKQSGTMLGGCMRKQSYAPYAKYFVKFVQAYAEAGVRVNAVSVQNEVDTNQDGRMPACQWGQEYEVEFVGQHLGPAFGSNNMNTKIWIIDHNYNLWGRAICELNDPNVNRYADGVAWHGYLGEPSAMTLVHVAHPEKHMYWTEGGPDITDPHYATDWAQWSTTFTGILRNWARCIIAWNMALDESGKPNIGPFSCGGLVTVNSKTKEITRSGQYHAFAHYSRAIRRGARRIESSGSLERVSHVAVINPDKSCVLVLTNAGGQRRVVVRFSGKQSEVDLPSDSITTLSWRSSV
jgi:glucosylceramidase